MKYIFIFLIFIVGCSNNDSEIISINNYDTIIKKSIKLNDSSVIILNLADKKTEKIVKETIDKVKELKEINESLKKEVNKIKYTPEKINTIIIRDTIYITEKRNFWGRKKVKIDSASSQSIIEDSVIKNEN